MKNKDVAGTKPEDTTTVDKTNDSSGPIWKTQFNRVQGAMWRRDHEGKTRYSISISRSYKDKDDGKWKNVHYFDSGDLDDVRALCHVAQEKILELDGMTIAADED